MTRNAKGSAYDTDAQADAVLVVDAAGVAVGDNVARTYSAPTNAAVATTSTAVAAANASRKGLVVVNDSDTVVYLAVNTAALLNKGIRLNAQGGAVQFGGPGGLPLTTEAVNGIHGGTGTRTVTVQEVT